MASASRHLGDEPVANCGLPQLHQNISGMNPTTTPSSKVFYAFLYVISYGIIAYSEGENKIRSGATREEVERSVNWLETHFEPRGK